MAAPALLAGGAAASADCAAVPKVAAAAEPARTPRRVTVDMRSTLIRRGAVDDAFGVPVFRAIGVAADDADLFEVVLGLEQIALLGLPRPIIGPRQRVIGIG